MRLLSVSEFCQQSGISRALFYKLVREGNGPRIMKVGRRTLISGQAAEEWQRAMEVPRQAA
jgi:excisionase family DNA binding protein